MKTTIKVWNKEDKEIGVIPIPTGIDKNDLSFVDVHNTIKINNIVYKYDQKYNVYIEEEIVDMTKEFISSEVKQGYTKEEVSKFLRQFLFDLSFEQIVQTDKTMYQIIDLADTWVNENL